MVSALRKAFALALAAALVPLGAETVVSAEIAASASAKIGTGGFSSVPEANGGSVSIGIDTARNEAVKASAGIAVNQRGELTLNRAWMKARMPSPAEGTSSRLTVGLAPLSWGKGFLFNAGDPIFGEMPAMNALSGSEYRTAADWLAAIYLPLGPFSFAEAVYLPPVIGPSTGSVEANAAISPRDRAGGRVQIEAGLPLLQSVEAGWLHAVSAEERGYAAADGSLWADWYAVAAFASKNPAASATGERVDGADWSLSGGLFRIIDLPDYPVTFRLEALAHPGRNAQNWFALMSVGLGDLASAGFQGVYATGSGDVSERFPSGSLVAGLIGEFSPVKGFTLSAQALRTSIPAMPDASGYLISVGARCKF